MELSPVLIAIIVVVVLVVAFAIFMTRRLVTVEPNQVIVVSSLGGDKMGDVGEGGYKKAKIYRFGRIFVWPIIQDYRVFSLTQYRTDMQLNTTDKNFIALNVIGNMQFKFADDDASLLNAIQRFFGKAPEDIIRSIQQSAEGGLKNIVNTMSYQEINTNREDFQARVIETVKSELASQGVIIDVLNITDVAPQDRTYAANLSAPEIARAEQDARIARAKAAQLASTNEAESAKTIAERERDVAVTKAGYQMEMAKAQAAAEASGERARAEQRITIAEQTKQALAAEAEVKEQQLNIDVVKPADAEAYAAQKKAEGQRLAAVQQADSRLYGQQKDAEANAYSQQRKADADAYAKKAEAEAQANATKAIAEADAAATSARGSAEADIIRAKGVAEADATTKKADALQKYGEQGMTFEVVSRLPQMMGEVAKSVAGIKEYTVISTDGASDATKQMGNILSQGLQMVKSVTGVDIAGRLQRHGKSDAAPETPADEFGLSGPRS